MPKKNLVYIQSLRNGAADRAGQPVAYKGGTRYMKAPLEFLVERLNDSPLGERYTLAGVIVDDDEGSAADRAKLADYGFVRTPGRPWILPDGLTVQGTPVDALFCSIPSTYRRLPREARERVAGKQAFERRLLECLLELNADVVVLDGLRKAAAKTATGCRTRCCRCWHDVRTKSARRSKAACRARTTMPRPAHDKKTG